ncbi:hypothetical protein SteCoe_11927 [Stentor coeruleus]|uniref:Uncharacterized protein n=1 Tax=Stentor coeruleus TaxID=5963 RepID=A0A1R2CC04_9CILI|nr:hypothetical protein SteCoe_11927 [Stentor coeruleus]
MLTPSLSLAIAPVCNEKIFSIRGFIMISILIDNIILILFCIVKSIDIDDIYSRPSIEYKKILKAYFIEDESLEFSRRISEKQNGISIKNIVSKEK